MSLLEIGKKLANIKIFFFSLLWLMVLTTVGTVAQKDIGLYEAQQIYFSSWIFWIKGVIPAPGGQLTMGVVFIGLLSQLIFKSPIKKRTIGVIITHVGALLLLLGGMITGYFSLEGNMVINEGETVDYFQDFHQLEVAIIDTSSSEHDRVFAFSSGWLKTNEVLKHNDLPFQIEIQKFCSNCAYEKRSDSDADQKDLHGFARNFILKEIPRSKEDAENRAGFTFRVKFSDEDGIYSIFEDMQIKQSLSAQGKKYFIEIRHKRRNLPFKIELINFDKTDYAATSMAKSYKSEVYLIDDSIKQRTVIQMNEPLRYKGYTFYQSSYIQENGKETTILSVVHNVGRMFPYISSIIICIGIIIHLLLLSGLFKSQNEN